VNPSICPAGVSSVTGGIVLGRKEKSGKNESVDLDRDVNGGGRFRGRTYPLGTMV
jgi:hypothetical protein